MYQKDFEGLLQIQYNSLAVIVIVIVIMTISSFILSSQWAEGLSLTD